MALEEWMEYGNMFVVIMSILMIAVSGIVMGFTYFFFDELDTAFRATDCTISGNNIASTCQELWNWSYIPSLKCEKY